MHLVPKMWTIETKLNVGWMSSYVKERQLQFAAESKVPRKRLIALNNDGCWEAHI